MEATCLLATPRRCCPKKSRRPPPRRVASESRRSLFDSSVVASSESDISDVSPLSKSSDDVYSPPMPSPSWSRSPRRTPLKCISPLKCNFDQLLIGARRKAMSTPPKRRCAWGRPLKGVSPLGKDTGVIAPTTFYGNAQQTPLDGVELLRKIRASLPETSKARTRLFLDDLPKDRKRARSGGGGLGAGGGAGGPVPWRRRAKRRKLCPVPVLTCTRQQVRAVKRKSPIQGREGGGASKKARAEIKRVPRAGPSPRLKERLCSWETYSFSRPPRSGGSTTPSSGPRKFFRAEAQTTPQSMCKDTMLTPPTTQKKEHKLLSNYDMDYLSPEKSGPQALVPRNRPKLPDDIVRAIASDVMDMLEDDREEGIKEEVAGLLRDLQESQDEEDDGVIKLLDNDNNSSPIAVATPNKFFSIFAQTSDTTPTPIASTKRRRRAEAVGLRKFMGGADDQYQIDAGQSSLSETQCVGCGLFYTRGDPQDEVEHYKYHNHCSELKYSGWKNERVVGVAGTDRMVCVQRDDPKSWWDKVRAVLKIVDSHLGFPDVPVDTMNCPKVLLYIKERRIVGALVAEVVRRAYRMLCADVGVDICTAEDFPCKCGVSRIWVHPQERQSGIATRMLDALRLNFVFGCALTLDDIAFTSPTEEGKLLAASYTKRSDYLVYM